MPENKPTTGIQNELLGFNQNYCLTNRAWPDYKKTAPNNVSNPLRSVPFPHQKKTELKFLTHTAHSSFFEEHEEKGKRKVGRDKYELTHA